MPFELPPREARKSGRVGSAKMAATYWIDGQPYSVQDVVDHLGIPKDSVTRCAALQRAKPGPMTWAKFEAFAARYKARVGA